MTDKEKERLKVAMGVMNGRISPLEYVMGDIEGGYYGLIRADILLAGDDVFDIRLRTDKERTEYCEKMRGYAEEIVCDLIIRALEKSE